MVLDDDTRVVGEWVVLAVNAAPGALLSPLISLTGSLPAVLATKGGSLMIEVPESTQPPMVIRTPNRDFACGLHVIPHGRGGLYLGATNRFTTAPATGPTAGLTGHRPRRPRARATAWYREVPQAGVETVVVPRPDITFQLLNGTQAAAHTNELRALHAEVYANPPCARNDDAALFADRFRVQRHQPGFVLAEARHGGYLVGYAAGMPLRPSTSWWRDLTTRLPDEITTEHPGRTFALVDLLVRASWRRQGIATTLHDLILRNRPEERATLMVLPATPAQKAFQKWGWRKVARTSEPHRGSPVFDVLVTTLPATRELRP